MICVLYFIDTSFTCRFDIQYFFFMMSKVEMQRFHFEVSKTTKSSSLDEQHQTNFFDITLFSIITIKLIRNSSSKN